ncbi:uncharacterized protein LOC112694861 isoform X1 [Athalia rosae]|uniref:uncharacterized protein LOC112694861 isoform X1 n=2 Tax=Athalia rosae TaxID=37344 RepID=UPI002033323D|nr:uncharacterized protein LOC112694861 isoform X1 [Athalia rosae]
MNQSIDPPVKCGYCGWLIGGCNNIIQHKCFMHFTEENDLLHVDDNFVVTYIPRVDTISTNTQITTDETSQIEGRDEILIQAVFMRPALYNIKLPIKKRTKLKKDALWLEVGQALGGTMTTEAIKKRWQYLRDCFTKSRNKLMKYKPSGSAADILNKGKQCFRFYEQMSFLCDSLPSIPTVSNIEPSSTAAATSNDSGCSSVPPNCNISYVSPATSSGGSTSSSVDPFDVVNNSMRSPPPPSRTPTPGAKRRKTTADNNVELRSALVSALQEKVPQTDAVDGFLARLGEGLRRIPYRERCRLEISFLTQLMEVEDQLNLPD